MFIGIPRVGSRVSWSIGKRGETPDLYPARINDAQGRQVSLFVLRQNASGEPYLAHVLTSTNFIESRDSLVDELDAPTLAQLAEKVVEEMTEHAAQRTADAAV